MSEYKLIDVVAQDVCFPGDPKHSFTDMSLVLAVLNHQTDTPENIRAVGGTPQRYTVRVTVEAKEI